MKSEFTPKSHSDSNLRSLVTRMKDSKARIVKNSFLFSKTSNYLCIRRGNSWPSQNCILISLLQNKCLFSKGAYFSLPITNNKTVEMGSTYQLSSSLHAVPGLQAARVPDSGRTHFISYVFTILHK